MALMKSIPELIEQIMIQVMLFKREEGRVYAKVAFGPIVVEEFLTDSALGVSEERVIEVANRLISHVLVEAAKITIKEMENATEVPAPEEPKRLILEP